MSAYLDRILLFWAMFQTLFGAYVCNYNFRFGGYENVEQLINDVLIELTGLH